MPLFSKEKFANRLSVNQSLTNPLLSRTTNPFQPRYPNPTDRLELRAGDGDNEAQCPIFRQSGEMTSRSPERPRMLPTKKSGKKRGNVVSPAKGESAPDRPVTPEPCRVGKRGAVVIPAALRRRYGIEEGTLVVAEPCEGGVLIRPALVLPIEVYTPERKAQFLLSNAVDAVDYVGAVKAVREMGLDPNAIPHYKPPGA